MTHLSDANRFSYSFLFCLALFSIYKIFELFEIQNNLIFVIFYIGLFVAVYAYAMNMKCYFEIRIKNSDDLGKIRNFVDDFNKKTEEKLEYEFKKCQNENLLCLSGNYFIMTYAIRKIRKLEK